MPVNKKMMSELKKEYGNLKGEKIYYALEAKQKKLHPGTVPFQHKKKPLTEASMQERLMNSKS